MSSSRRNPGYWVSAWLPVLIGLCIIAMESTEAFGSDRTSGPLRALYQTIFGRVGDANWPVIHHLIRKSGHFIGYGLLGLAWLRAWWMALHNPVFLKAAVLAMLGTAMTASADEYHQSFLPNRTSSVLDVLLDCTGALVMLSIAYLLMQLFRSKRLRDRG
jgi:VanZ family protein